MKITRQQIEALDTQTLLNAVDWLFDSNRRFELSGTIGRMSKAKAEYERAMTACRKHCLERLLYLAEASAGSANIADTVEVWPCPRCDSCGWPVIQNCGDEYTNLCPVCAGVYHTGTDAAEYIKQKANNK
jgi:hypothetical protein